MASNKVSKKAIFLTLNLVVIGGLIYALNDYVNGKINNVTVYVYKGDIAEKAMLSENDIMPIQIPADGKTEGFEVDKQNIVGKYAATKLIDGSYIYKRQLIDESSVDEFSKMDLSKLRRIAMPVDTITTFGGDVKKGSRIDLSYTETGTNKTSGQPYIYTKIFMQNIPIYEVLSANGQPYERFNTETATKLESAEAAEQQKAVSNSIGMIVLALTPEQYEEIKTRQSKGKVEIVGRFEKSESRETYGYSIGQPEKSFMGVTKTENGKTIIVEDSGSQDGWNE